MARKKTIQVPNLLWGEVALPCEMELVGQNLPPVVEGGDSSLEAAVRWLESPELAPREREQIQASILDASHRMAAFQQLLGYRRAGRLARNQDWLDDIQDRLLSGEVMAAKGSDPWYLLQVGRFLADMQRDDTAYIQNLAKTSESSSLAAAQAAIDRQSNQSKTDAQKMAESIPPHQREKLRRLTESLLAKLKEQK